MAKGIWKGEVPSDDPMFGKLLTHSDAVFKKSTKTSPPATAGENTPAERKEDSQKPQ
jgi:hypothetical protein